jgi:hypothetical protein
LHLGRENRVTNPVQSPLLAKDVALFFVLAIITIIPIFYFDVLPLHDLPSHLARLAVIQSKGNDPILSQYYALDWHLIPNLALDMWAYLTTPFLDVEMASRCFIALSFLLLTSGTIFVHRALGGTGPWPFVSFIFIWNEILAWGFLSFLFSIGVALWLFGAWVKYRHCNIVARVALHAVAAVGLLICHLFGFAVYALAVGAYEVGNVALKWRACGVQMPSQEFFGGALQFIPALVLFFTSQTSSGAAMIQFGGLIQKISNYSTPILLYAPLVQLIIVALFGLIIAYSIGKRWARIPPPCWFIIVIGVVCTIVAPSMMFNSYFLSHRMPVALSFLFIATIQFAHFDRLRSRLFRGGLVTIVAAHTMFIAWHWAGYQLIYKDLFAATGTVEEGTKVLSMTLGTERYASNLRPPLIRAVEYLVPTKKIFSPHMLIDSWHQPMRLTEQARKLRKLAPIPLFSPAPANRQKLVHVFENTAFDRFDYVLTIRMDAYEDLFPKNWILLDRVGLFRLYQPGVNPAQPLMPFSDASLYLDQPE